MNQSLHVVSSIGIRSGWEVELACRIVMTIDIHYEGVASVFISYKRKCALYKFPFWEGSWPVCISWGGGGGGGGGGGVSADIC